MATAPVLLSIEEYLRTSYKPDVDYVDGEIEERNVGKYEHARLQWLIGGFFLPKEKLWNIHGVTEQRVRVTPTRIRVCDLVLLSADAPREEVTETPPLLCIEIMSPEDRLPRAKLVLADYLSMGVKYIWLIDPIRRAAYTFDADGLHEADPTNLTIPQTSIRLDLTEAFAAID
jgi:Uma2 family endonuclease